MNFFTLNKMSDKKKFIKKIVKKHKCLNNIEKKGVAIMLLNMGIKIKETTDKTQCFLELSKLSLDKLKILHKSIDKHYQEYKKMGEKILN